MEHKMTNKDFLWWIYNRLINIHGENQNYDYMLKLRHIIETAAVDEHVDDDYKRLYIGELNKRRELTSKIFAYEELLDEALYWYVELDSSDKTPEWVNQVLEQLEGVK